MDQPLRTAPARDPAWQGRLFWVLAVAVVLWPLGVATEFRPWVLIEPENLKVTGQFLGSFWPLAHDGEFLAMVARETWRTVAMATAGVTLALVVAIPLTLINTRVLSISALSGRMARGPFWLRQSVRWLLIVLRSIPELVWALVFVRVVGLGPTAGVLAIALTYGGMLG
ncbi:MAG: ABC transporter permease, partial [Burkholderiales bacterium]